MSVQPTRADHRIAWLTALAITIHIAESALPNPLPGVKPGLANVVTIAVLCLYGWRMAAWVSLLRVLVGSLLLGTFLSPTFVLSLTGALCSITTLGAAHLLGARLPGAGFGPVGFSLLAAMAHVAGQFYCAYWLFIPHAALFTLLPVLMSMAVVLGVINGIITRTMLQRVTP
ncbi:MAG: Gx transporter family protein [Gammaproteobacteria bacterium]